MPIAGVTLPGLITVELYKWISQAMATPPDDDHVMTVMIIFWVLLAATSSAYVSLAWHRVYRARPEQNDDRNRQTP